MKKLFGILVCFLLLTGCDDGDLVLESFDFDTVAIQKCPNKNLLFKINGDELLLMDIPASFFPPEVTPADQPRIVTISGTNQVLYRKYSGTASNNTICSEIPPANPTVNAQWTAANGGTIQITTTERTTTDPVTNETTLVGHNHQIKFTNIQFVGENDTFVFEEYLFGTYTTNL